jgi:hypothetical protein
LLQYLIESELFVHDNLLRAFCEPAEGRATKPSAHGSITGVVHLHKHPTDEAKMGKVQ